MEEKLNELSEAFLDLQTVFEGYLEAKEMVKQYPSESTKAVYSDIALIRLPDAERVFLTKLNLLK